MRIKPLILTVSIYIIMVVFTLYYMNLSAKKVLLGHYNKQLFTAALAAEAILGDSFHNQNIANQLEKHQSNALIDQKLSLYANKCGFIKIYAAIKLNGMAYETASSETKHLKKRQIFGRFIQSFTPVEKKLYQSFNRSSPLYFSYKTDKDKIRGIYLPRESSDGNPYVICCELPMNHKGPLPSKHKLSPGLKGDHVILLLFFAILPVICIFIFKNEGSGICHRETLPDMNQTTRESFLAIMSHEIKNPINSVISINQLLKETPLTKVQQEYVEMIQTSSRNLVRIIDNVLEFTKIESRDLKLNTSEFDILAFLDEVIYSASLQLGDKRIFLGYEITPSVPRRLITDEGRLNQIVTNLVTNAIKYTRSGYIFISVSYKEIDEDNILTVEINDTGIGIEKEKQHAIFDLFYQVNESLPNKAKGVGLGLAICKKLITAMKGSIWVASTYGKGSTFSFFVRCQKKISPLKPAERLAPDPYKIILLVKYSLSSHCLKSVLRYLKIPFHEMDRGQSFSWNMLKAPSIVITDHPVILKSALLKKIKNIHKMIYISSQRHPGTEQIPQLSIPIRALKLLALLTQKSPEIPLTKKTLKPPTNEKTFADKYAISILYADDSLINRKVMNHMLGKLGYKADGAEDGEAVITACQKKHYDLIFMDMRMPRVDGLEASKRLRKTHGKDRPVIIALTANAMESHKETCLSAGMNDFLTKPIDISRLKEKIIKYAS